MEVEQLRHFVKVVELENFSRAAEQIGLSQSALSRSIARLEEELGQPVLERQTRKVVLNDAGRLLLKHAQKILNMINDAKAEICDDGQSGNIRVGAIPTIAPYFLPECLQSFHRQYPLAQVIVQEETTDHLLKKVVSGEVDVAIAALPITEKHLKVEKLFSEELLLVMPREHPLTRRKSINVSDIEELPFVLLGEAHCLSNNVINYCRQKSFHPVSVERTSQLSMVQELVALGHGISLVPSMAFARDGSKSRAYRSLTGVKPMRTIVMVSNPYRFHSQMVRRFEEHVIQGWKWDSASTQSD